MPTHISSSTCVIFQHQNATACQVLGNLCVLTMYEYNPGATGTLSRACDLVRKIVVEEREFA